MLRCFKVIASVSIWNFPDCPPTPLCRGEKGKTPAVSPYSSTEEEELFLQGQKCLLKKHQSPPLLFLSSEFQITWWLPSGQCFHCPAQGIGAQPQEREREFTARPTLHRLLCPTVLELSEERKGRRAVSIRNGTQRSLGVEMKQEQVGVCSLIFMVLYYGPAFPHTFFKRLKEITLVGMCDIPKGILVCLVTSAWERTEPRDYVQIKGYACVGAFRYSV